MTEPISDFRLLELQVEALFTHDAAGRIHVVNEPDGIPAPRFFLGRTGEGNLWRLRHDLPPDIATTLTDLAAQEPVRGDLRAEPRNLEAFLDALRQQRCLGPSHSGPAYRFPDDLPAPSNVTAITPQNLHVLEPIGWDIATLSTNFEARAPLLAVVEDDVAVSVCFCARLTGRAAEAGVETLEAHRGRGHAANVVAAWPRRRWRASSASCSTRPTSACGDSPWMTVPDQAQAGANRRSR